MTKLVEELKAATTDVLQGGGAKPIERHVSKGKLLARDRINYLLDKNTSFLELSTLAAYDMYGKDKINSAGVITGIGKING